MSDAEPEPPRHKPQELRSEELLRGGKEVAIRHGADLYRLRITASGKLILTK